MSQETFWILLSKKLSGEASLEELVVLENLILEHPEWQLAIQNLGEIWKYQPKKDQTEEEDAYMLHLQRMQELNVPFGNMPDQTPVVSMSGRKKMKRWYWAAAVLLVLASTWALLMKPFKGGQGQEMARQVSEITTRPGSTSKVELPDGSMVWLNAGSKLTYNKDFGKELREVTLSGEGYFDVTKMKDKPFIIHTSNINIKVLGTAFNVKAYPEDKLSETSLIRGSIEVTIKNRPNDKIILSPSEKLVVENDRVVRRGVVQKPVDAPVSPMVPMVAVNKLRYSPADSSIDEIAWMDNRLIFRNETMEELALRMERRYAVQIQIEADELKEMKVNGIFDQESVAQALEALKEMIPSINYVKEGNQIIINR
ncbi:MAG: FecR family protein [Chitinophagaceae bacterium]|nr:FecR family protein [Chitinophagaceae bacterium]MBP6591116.1 FecR family protein [Chitinophagaceae bacterium]MBP8243712.1 FecR family protein [Chitinophagaceae bacterium]